MKFLTSLVLAFSFFTNSMAFATSHIKGQESLKKGLDQFVAKVEKTKSADAKRQLISNSLNNISQTMEAGLDNDELTEEERNIISEIGKMNENYKMALSQVPDEELNNFAQAYATEYQKAGGVLYVLSILLAIGAGVWLVANIGCIFNGGGFCR